MSQTDAERANPYEEGVLTAIRGALAGVWTALPGLIVDFDPALQTAKVQPTIQAQVTNPDGSRALVTLPLLLDCPVHFPRGGEAVLTFPVVASDECLVIFSSRCIDSWWQNGGIQPPAELRMHDLSDGFALVGFSSRPQVIEGLSTTQTQLRSLDGSTVISLNPNSQIVRIEAPGGISLVSPTLTHNGVPIGDTHKHSGVAAGGAISGNPIP